MEVFEKKTWWELIDELEEWYIDNYSNTPKKHKGEK